MNTNKTYLPKVTEIKRQCYVIDASDKILGRIATKVAVLLRGKHKIIFTPHLDVGDSVIIINADKIKVTGTKMQDKIYLKYTGYPSGLRKTPLKILLNKRPEKVLRLAVERMIPEGRLGNRMRKRLRVYAGNQHPHQAQKPIPFQV